MQDEQLQSGPGNVDPNENQEQVKQEEGVNEGSGNAEQASDAEQASETLTEDSSKNQVEEGDLDSKETVSAE